jgi:hypothetical protein
MASPPGSFGEGAQTRSGLTVMPLAEVDNETRRRFHTKLLEPAFPPAELMAYEEPAMRCRGR